MSATVLMLAVAVAAAVVVTANVAFTDGSQSLLQTPNRPNDHMTQDLRDVLSASKRILDYYKPHVKDINIDAVLGTRIAEAQYAILLDALDNDSMAPRDGEAVEVIRQLHADIKTFNTKALDFIRKAYSDEMKDWDKLFVTDFFKIPLTFLQLDNSSTSDKQFDSYRVLQGVEQLHEGQSDVCITEVLLTGEQKKLETQKLCMNQEYSAGRCLMSGWCWSTMTGKGYSGYSLTHQLLYLIIAMQTGCRTQIDDIIASTGREPLEDMIKGFCNNIFMEARAIDEAGYPEMIKDLFMEQGVLCGIIGYVNFHSRPWVHAVLSWQRNLGCYGDYQLYEKDRHKPRGAQSRMKREEKSVPGNNRVKRAEKSMPGHCMAHTSATAISYLSIALKTLIFQ